MPVLSVRKLLARLISLRQGRRPQGQVSQRPRLETLEDRVLLSVFTVTNTNDSGPGSLRQALFDASASADNTVAFDIPGDGVHTIHLAGGLSVGQSTTVDGSTQPGYAGAPLIELDGSHVSGTASSGGLYIFGTGITVRGLIINGFTGSQVLMEGSDDILAGNYIGTDATGTRAVQGDPGIAGNGVRIMNGIDNTIGGTTAADRNLISGNVTGVSIGGYLAHGNVVEGNYIGTDATGTQALANTFGVAIEANANTVGGTAAGAGNVISGNFYGVQSVDSQDNVVAGNLIGTDGTGTRAVGNLYGVQIVDDVHDTIGGTDPGAGNVISGNTEVGVITNTAGAGIYDILIAGNYIGTDLTGTRAVGNAIGISLASDNVTVGGTTAAARNIISGNTTVGIGVGAQHSLAIAGNYIGTDVTGAVAVPNRTGVRFGYGATNCLLGGTADGAGNLVSGNSLYGVQIADVYASGNLVEGNLIGTNAAGTAGVGNAYGVYIYGSVNNTIGGTAAGAGNLISGNAIGVAIGFADGNLVVGNAIGTDVTGTLAVPNVDGIDLLSGASTVGGAADGSGNLISGNTNAGIAVDASACLIEGNVIGTDITGTLRLANATGILLAGSDNTIGGTAGPARNLISGNQPTGFEFPGGSGIDLFGVGASGNVIEGNLIGTDVSGTRSLGNYHGVTIESGASNNLIGGTAAGAGNLISGNVADGLNVLSGANRIQGNYIGTDAGGTNALPNPIGIVLQQGGDNLIGGPGVGASNVVSGNNGLGIKVYTQGNVFQGNLIGLTATGTATLGNGTGILFMTQASNNTIGGTATGAGNVISGNYWGILLESTGNIVAGNLIGTDLAGSTTLGNFYGIFVQGSNNTIGGTAAGAGNLVSGNLADGITITSSVVSGNSVQGNLIGTDASGTLPLGNGGQGLVINFRAGNNTVGGTEPGAANVIAFNGGDGVLVDGGTGNAIQGNRIFANAALGIELRNGGNEDQPAPVLIAASAGGGLLTLQGNFTGAASTTYTLEFFANSDPANPGQGQQSLGFITVTTDASGTADFTITLASGVAPGEFVTATATDPDNNTSAFSTPVLVTS
jgi:titin